MEILPYDKLSEQIRGFAADQQAVLFAGAGIGRRVGLPLWHQYLEELACLCQKHGDDLARALAEMEAAYARAMPEVIDSIVEQGKQELEAEGLDWGSANQVEDLARTAKFIDRLEENFFEKMRWWIEKEERESGNTPSGLAAKSE